MTNGEDKANPEVSTHGQMHESGMLYGDTYSTGGLTKREHFAAMAMQGICSLSNWSGTSDSSCDDRAKFAVKMADALINALNK